MFKSIADHLDKALAAGSGFAEPFRVHRFKPFSDELYQAILEHLPENNFYQSMPHIDALRPDGSSTRGVLGLPGRIGLLPARQIAFWRKLAEALRSREVTNVFKKHLAPELKERFKTPTVANLILHPTLMLMRDSCGYKISPHPDKPSKICTIQMYLPRDDSRPQLGTSFYKMLDEDGFLSLVHTIDYLPNTGYAFTVSEDSWHGTVFGDFVGVRDSLLLTYYLTPFERY